MHEVEQQTSKVWLLSFKLYLKFISKIKIGCVALPTELEKLSTVTSIWICDVTYIFILYIPIMIADRTTMSAHLRPCFSDDSLISHPVEILIGDIFQPPLKSLVSVVPRTLQRGIRPLSPLVAFFAWNSSFTSLSIIMSCFCVVVSLFVDCKSQIVVAFGTREAKKRKKKELIARREKRRGKCKGRNNGKRL